MLLQRILLVCLMSCIVNAVPVVFKESTPNGESIVAISSSDPEVEKYISQQFSTRSGSTQVKDDTPQRPGNVHSSISVSGPGKAAAAISTGRGFASASSGPFFPLFTYSINPDFGFNGFPDIKNWVRSFENFYNPNFGGDGQINSVTAINDNGHVYGNVKTVTFDNKLKDRPTHDNTGHNKYN